MRVTMVASVFASLLVAVSPASAAGSLNPSPTSSLSGSHLAVRIALVFVGAAVFLGTYGPSCAAGRNELCIPVAGPFLLLDRRVREDQRSSSNAPDGIVPPAFVYAALASLGVVEMAGLTLVGLGVLVPDGPRARPDRPAVTLAPALAPGTAGIFLAGRF